MALPANIIKVLVPAMSAFAIGILSAPLLTHYLFKYKVWKKTTGKTALDGSEATEFKRIRETQHAGTETKTPRMGGLLIWVTVLVVTLGISLLAQTTGSVTFAKLDFLSRSQTWIPLIALLAGGVMGFANDLLDVSPSGERGVRLSTRLLFVTVVSGAIGWWFYAKLGMTAIGIPTDGTLALGPFIIPLFIIVSLGIYAGGVIDGIDGLSGGVFSSIFASYAIIAFSQQQINLAAFSATVAGGILAFLWFNVPPARFYMTETGTMALTLTIAVLAFMTDTLGHGIGISVLPIVGGLLCLTVASNILQVASKKFCGKKLFRIAPLHHHFEAIGWPGYKVTMRYWILSIVLAFAGVILAIIAS